ncbi:hypothetical protein CEP54_016296 [Fusarium duplospermum]|uniref:Uncharacterized protein n=1 Tax=Fusarium duplospermum TaxID=1325734 RepID=A0A428NFK1_9HYPO|nr:hypothetical protein CEP54_016296 [Fusarium duplospermum]
MGDSGIPTLEVVLAVPLSIADPFVLNICILHTFQIRHQVLAMCMGWKKRYSGLGGSDALSFTYITGERAGIFIWYRGK